MDNNITFKTRNPPFSWRCPHCNHDSTISDLDFVDNTTEIKINNKYGNLAFYHSIIVCPNIYCKELYVSAILSKQTSLGEIIIRARQNRSKLMIKVILTKNILFISNGNCIPNRMQCLCPITFL